MNIYYVGGSPCSGKSTIVQALSERYGLQYFKVDDHLDRYMKMGAADGKERCARVAAMSPEQIWMRDPMEQCEEELQIYEEISAYIQADLEKMRAEKGIITEGAAYLPVLAKRWNVLADRYLSMTPTKEFQVTHYRRREWVPYVLEGCSDSAKAFENWMERDALFAKAVQRQCAELGYASWINDGEMAVEEMIAGVAAHFGFM